MTPRIVTEAELDREFGVKAQLASTGNYGCHCAVFDGDVQIDELAFEDTWFHGLRDHTTHDIGTVVMNGNVRCKEASVSDRLMCLVIRGDLVAERFAIFETEVLVCGDATIATLTDHDGYLKVLGKLTVVRQTTYDDPD